MAAALISIYPDLAGRGPSPSALAVRDTASTRLPGTPVLIVDGSKDDRRKSDDGRRFAEHLKDAGAAVTHHQVPAGHAMTEADYALVREWLVGHF